MAFALTGLLAGASEARASTLIYINDGLTGDLWEYDSGNNYSERLVGTYGTTVDVPGFGPFFGAAFSISSGPAANTIYYTSYNGTGYGLSTVDVVTGDSADIGGNVAGNTLGEGRDGWLYTSSGGADLVRVNPATGATVVVGTGTYGYAGDIAVDPTNNQDMYGAVMVPGTTVIATYDYGNGQVYEQYDSLGVALVRINRFTGAQTLVGMTGVGVSADPMGSPASIFGLGFALDGTLFATGPTTSTYDPGTQTYSYSSTIYTIDTLTGLATAVHSVNYAAYDMATQPYATQETPIDNPPAFQPPGTGAVPEPMTLGLVGLGAAAAAVRSRRA